MIYGVRRKVTYVVCGAGNKSMNNGCTVSGCILEPVLVQVLLLGKYGWLDDATGSVHTGSLDFTSKTGLDGTMSNLSLMTNGCHFLAPNSSHIKSGLLKIVGWRVIS